MAEIAINKDKSVNIDLKPPPIKVLDARKPDISMLKLMIASDNSSEGVGKVYEGLVRQSGLGTEKFASRLTVLKGDLGIGAHILWNFTQAFISFHWGDSTDSKDLGCWHFFKALGIKSSQVLNKKDFSLMLVQLTKVHEATIGYLLL
ncbi:hypothetical protein PCANC_18676 [Puccinia coronata f. sp. avenae]|uniref:DUF6589 domain-containing protein n=1 Tax=Puccinia coronata f. sp. avenae TaxID=200324 RepID=A0A2N5VC90_9BASI|nr:hypothetical protein PCANC_18676 [Puccinia coronata f. sp. avenae]